MISTESVNFNHNINDCILELSYSPLSSELLFADTLGVQCGQGNQSYITGPVVYRASGRGCE